MSNANTKLRASLEALLAQSEAHAATIRATLATLDEPAETRRYTLDEAGKACNISPHTLRTWCKSGRLTSYRGTRDTYLVTLADIDAAVEVEPSKPRPRIPRTESGSDDAWEAEQTSKLQALGGDR